MRYYHYEKADKDDTIYGVHSSELPVEFLSKMNVSKIIKCCKTDSRLLPVVEDRISSMTAQEIPLLRHIIKNPDVKKYPGIVDKYNAFLRNNRASLEQSFRWSERAFIIDEWIDEANFLYETNRWVQGESSYVSDKNIDFNFMFKHYPTEASKKVDKFITRIEESRYYHSSSLENMMSTLPSSAADNIFPRLNKLKPRERAFMLSSPHLDPKYFDDVLRAVSKLKDLPKINAPIRLEHYKKLPPITRLDLLEHVLDNRALSNEFIKETSEEDFNELFFTSMMRYPARVERVANSFKNQKTKISKG